MTKATEEVKGIGQIFTEAPEEGTGFPSSGLR